MRMTARLKPLDHDTTDGAAAGRRPLAVLAIMLVSACASSAFAQGAPPCTAIENDAERLACYDRALRPAAAPAPAPAAPAPASAAPAPGPSAAAPSPPSAAAAPVAAPVAAPAAAPATAPPAPTAARTAAPAPASASQEAQILPVVVVGMRSLPGRETTFTMEDGSAWVQTDSQRITGFPDPPYAAELKPGLMGSYFLVPKERGRSVRVRQATPR